MRNVWDKIDFESGSLSETLLDKHCEKNMVEWDQAKFKKDYPKLHKSIIGAMDEALHLLGKFK